MLDSIVVSREQLSVLNYILNELCTEGSRTSLPQDGSRGKIEEKNMVFLFFVSLACSRDFISAIFGFLRKFRIDILLGVQKKFVILFRDEKFSKNPKSVHF